jgi:hypothetical protein
MAVAPPGSGTVPLTSVPPCTTAIFCPDGLKTNWVYALPEPFSTSRPRAS